MTNNPVAILAIDTSSELGSAVMRVNGHVRGELRLEGSMQHSDRLFATIDQVIRASDMAMDQIDVFAAVRGPGSFTGLRVGLAAIEGFAFATDKTAIGISALSALAWQVGPVDALIAPMLDARRGEVYGALFRRSGEELIEVRTPAVLQPAEWVNSLPADPIVFCGPGAEDHGPLIDNRFGSRIVPVDRYLASSVASMAASGHREPLKPLYIRPSDAKMRGVSRGPNSK